MIMNRKKSLVLLLGLLLSAMVWVGLAQKAKAQEPIVIVIDPGHGGENRGGEYEQYVEKEMNPIVAAAMKEELEKYENVTVYLTHEQDVDMSIKDRVLFAKEKEADFLFCLHFNMSVNHNLFGAEVWVPATGEYYAKGRSFAEIEMEAFRELGLYSRGIKTRLNDQGENYYGILRYGTQYDVNTVLIEHCHLDQVNDQPFYQKGEEQLREFGIMDATAVAKYFHLKSEILGVDYSDYPVPETKVPETIVRPDMTEPETCQIKVADINEEKGEVTIEISAEDSDSYILYYDYSLDVGQSFSELQPWPMGEKIGTSLDHCSFTVSVPYEEETSIVVNAYNGYDLFTRSNVVFLQALPDPEKEALKQKELKEQERRKAQESYEEIHYDDTTLAETKEASPDRWRVAAVIVLILLCMIFVTLFMAARIEKLLRHKRKK